MKILQIDTDCTDNGEGLRTVIYVSGCWHRCIGCHNQESWKQDVGYDYSIQELVDIVEDNPIADVTISGGDSLTFQYQDTLKLLKQIKKQTDKTIWLYSGYRFEELLKDKGEILCYIDVLVDGRFEINKKDLTLLFRGSSNQRIINVQDSLINNKVVLWREGDY